jgi:hypothetical protein
MIITLEQFQSGPLKIPNAVATPGGADRTKDIQAYIDRYEREILIKGLGAVLYNLVKDAHSNLPTSLENAEQRIKDLVNGLTYVVNGKQVIWEGLKSFPAYYIFYKYLTASQDIFTTFGVERPEGANSQAVSAIPKAVSAYQQFHEKYQGIEMGPRQVHNASGAYGIDWYGNRKTDRSLVQYLLDNEDVYPEAEFTPVDNINTFGI